MRREEPCLPVRRYFRGGRTWLGTRRKGEKCQVRQAEGSLNSAYCISFRGALLALRQIARRRHRVPPSPVTGSGPIKGGGGPPA